MGDVVVTGADLSEGRIARLRVEMHGLPARTIDRDTALAWMRDGHSLIPWVDASRSTALQLVEAGEGEQFIRHDNQPDAADALPSLPAVGG